ncbi:ArsO family NAD(P)H-dependent flavin-containing monooxygenase [Streptomyces bambusae]|uniref:ArsO family NAD(P)H-dependent flavin-containing monooxygenase n=1 Tax=Streptomyces bambusae TaxID=1550616 RepID=UPI001CFC96FE|nr:ArsO family NAD(P)H-dependent flavin-containing monooxygenase [Streptomyces bambusae]MCB5168874.1 ArsO family NAD(P)H-dependent flavin-containing monooxygenase [Streptomyces bambusae]
MTRHADVVVVGGGQAGLAAGYHLRRAGIDFTILDAQAAPGGAWQHAWDSLHLFSPAAYSSLPGRLMPAQAGKTFPDVSHVLAYLADYEKRYELPVQRGVRVEAVRDQAPFLHVRTDSGDYTARVVISATGTWWRPFLPAVSGRELFRGRRHHTVDYRSPGDYAGQRVIVVGGGNSGAQIAADLAPHATVRWVTQRPARYLPDDVDGSALFRLATQRVQSGGPRISDLGDIVAVPPVRAARDAGLIPDHRMFDSLTADGARWADGSTWPSDTIIWCTGFRPTLSHLSPLGLRTEGGRIPTEGTRAVADPRLHLLGYGDWTGPASATLIGVGRTARGAVREIADFLGS